MHITVIERRGQLFNFEGRINPVIENQPYTTVVLELEINVVVVRNLNIVRVVQPEII